MGDRQGLDYWLEKTKKITEIVINIMIVLLLPTLLIFLIKIIIEM